MFSVHFLRHSETYTLPALFCFHSCFKEICVFSEVCVWFNMLQTFFITDNFNSRTDVKKKEVSFEVIVLFPSNTISKIFGKKKLIFFNSSKERKKLVAFEVHCLLLCNELCD